MKALTVIALLAAAYFGAAWLEAHPPQPANADATTTTTHLPAVIPKAALVIRGVKMPDDCQDPAATGLQAMVTYIEKNGDPNKPGFIPDPDIAGYVCGWN